MSTNCINKGLRAAALAALALTGYSAQAQQLYQLESELKIPSPNAPNWDYLAYDTSRDYVYIARREDGILMYDVKAKKIVGALEDTLGGNATTLIPELDKGFVTNLDGTLTVFKISTLKKLDKIKVGKDADNTFYDPVTKTLLITMGDSKEAGFVDAVSHKVLGTVQVDSEKLEGTAPDGEGNMYMALRDRDKIVKWDMKQRKIVGEMKPDACVLPNGVQYDMANKRILVTCRGDRSILAVLDPATGQTVSKTPIGRNNDIVIFDAEAKKIYTSNGGDGNIVIINQIDANTYKIAEAPTTRPWARVMTIDPKSKKIYVVTAEGTVDASKSWKESIHPFYPNKYFKDTFVLLTYAPK